jgi:large subunit ribosomal protein L35
MKNKMKTHKGLKKRIRITAKGKVRIRKAGAGHLMSGKTGNRCRNLRRPKILGGTLAKNIKDVISKA